MHVKGATVQQVLLALALLAGVCWNLAHAAELRGVDLRSGATGTRAELRLDQESGYQLISLSGPERLVVDLPGTRQGKALHLPAASGLVRAVRSGQPAPGTLRIVFDLATPVVALKPHFEPGPDGPRLVLEWPEDGQANAVAHTAAPAASEAASLSSGETTAEVTSRPTTPLAQKPGPALTPIVSAGPPQASVSASPAPVMSP